MHKAIILEYQAIYKDVNQEPRHLEVQVTDKRKKRDKSGLFKTTSGYFKHTSGFIKGKSTEEVDLHTAPSRYHRCLLIDDKIRYDVIGGNGKIAFRLNITKNYNMYWSKSEPVVIEGPKSFKSDDFDSILRAVPMPGPDVFLKGDEFDEEFYDENEATDCHHWTQRAYNALQ